MYVKCLEQCLAHGRSPINIVEWIKYEKSKIYSKSQTLLRQLGAEISFSHARAHIHHQILDFLSSSTGFRGKVPGNSLKSWVGCPWGVQHLLVNQSQKSHVKILKYGFSAKFIFLEMFFHLDDFIYFQNKPQARSFCCWWRWRWREGGAVEEEGYRNISLIMRTALIIKPVSPL